MDELILKFVEDTADHEYEVVQFHGNLDSHSVPTAQRLLREHMSELDRPYIVFDFSDCSFINSNGIGLLMEIHMVLTKEHQQLLIAGAQYNVADILRVVGMSKIVPVFKTISEAIHFIKKKI